MALSWNEIRRRAYAFSKRWEEERSEHAEAKPFWAEFLDVFGVDRKRVASFEEPVKKLGEKRGFIDLYWKGMLLIEHKPPGKCLDSAYPQALDYFHGMKDRDFPKFVLVSDFARFRLYDIEAGEVVEFELRKLHKNIRRFGFVAGYITKKIKPEDPVNIRAAELMGRLHDGLKGGGYHGHALERYLVRLLFCLFAEDTGIFGRQQFQEYIVNKTSDDGSNLGSILGQLFEILNTPRDQRLAGLDEDLMDFDYINGKLFEERLPAPSFGAEMRNQLLDCCALDWSTVSPAIFGSLFQSVMNVEARRNLGAHYTSETNILKLIRPLFLDELYAEFHAARASPKKLVEFHKRLRGLKFLDPSCGCGNFLVIAYRELRILELELLRDLHKKNGTGFLDMSEIVWLDVDQFYGIEVEEFPALIAQVAMWLADHQMNQVVSEEFGNYFARLPLSKSAAIVFGNALHIAWNSLVSNVDFILGNPPFVGAMVMREAQRQDMERTFRGLRGFGVLDYVAAWYLKAAQYMQGRSTRTGFVSTNSICQGEQVGILWRELINRYHIHIHFAHRTFKWNNDAKGKAAVHCVIVGFGPQARTDQRIWDYERLDAEPHEYAAKHINPYLVDAPTVLLTNRTTPVCEVPAMRFGSMPRDGGHLILSAQEAEELMSEREDARKWLRPYAGAQEFLNGDMRLCLWLEDISPDELAGSPMILARVRAVREFRLASKAAATRQFAMTPALFCQIAQPRSRYLLVPRVSSERRKYVPIGFMSASVIASDQVLTISGASPYHFGILSSEMHNVWMRYTCGRLKSDFRYSKDVVYNNFPWPDSSEAQRTGVWNAAQAVLEVRERFSGTTLSRLYDPLTMPPELAKAHARLDRAVDAAYRRAMFKNESQRIAYLFERYVELVESAEARGNETDLAAA